LTFIPRRRQLSINCLDIFVKIEENAGVPHGGVGVFALRIESSRLAGHRRATVVAFAAALDAPVHVANLLAAFSASFADLCACVAVVLVKVAVTAHEVDAGVTCGDAIEHQFDVILLNVLASFFQTHAGQHVVENGLAFLAILNAILFRCGCGTHGISFDWKDVCGPVAAAFSECNLHTTMGYIPECRFDTLERSCTTPKSTRHHRPSLIRRL
jgi:hypothetical protein